MDEVRKFGGQVLGLLWFGMWAIAGMLVWFAIVGVWCLVVFLLSGRLPWMVRRYF